MPKSPTGRRFQRRLKSPIAPAARQAKARKAPDPSSPVARLQKAAKRAKDEGDMTQAETFAQAARDLECRNLKCKDDDEALKGVLRKLAKSK